MRLQATSVSAALCVLLLAAAAGAQEPVRTLTLEESVRLGLAQNPRLRAADADATAADAVSRQARALQLPALRAQGSLTRLSGNIPPVEFTLPGLDSTLTFQGVQLNRYYTELSLELPLLTQLRLREETRAARHEAAAATLRAEQERIDVAYAIRRAYWELYRARALRTQADAALALVEEHVAEVRARLDAGAALRRDLLAARTRRSEVALERVEAENAVRVGRLELNRLLGLPLDTPAEPADVLPAAADTAAAPAAPAALAASDTLAIRDPAARPELAALWELVRGERARLRAADALRLPVLDFVSRYVYAQPNPYFFAEQDRFRGTWELGLAARWGVWEGGRTAARVGEARARLEAAEARLADARERAAVETTRQRLEVQRAAEALDVAAENVAEAAESFRVVRQQYAEGAALATDVLDAEEAYRRAQARQAGARADLGIAQAALLAALGRTW